MGFWVRLLTAFIPDSDSPDGRAKQINRLEDKVAKQRRRLANAGGDRERAKARKEIQEAEDKLADLRRGK